MVDNKSYKIALVQMECSADENNNISTALARMKEAHDNGANIVCLPELFKNRYFCQKEDPDNFDLAEPVPGSTTKKFAKLAAEIGVVVIVPLFEKRVSGIYHNSLAVIDTDGKLVNIYRKMHIPDDPGYYEKYYFTPGDEGFKAADTSYAKIGTLICWDQWFPEAARLTALSGAGIIFYPTAIGWHPSEKKEFGKRQLDAWITVQRGHAIANGVYIGAVNRVGYEDGGNGGGIEFWGSSFICGPQGELISQASQTREEIIYADISQNQIENIRRNWPFLRDRRIESYKEISERVVD